MTEKSHYPLEKFFNQKCQTDKHYPLSPRSFFLFEKFIIREGYRVKPGMTEKSHYPLEKFFNQKCNKPINTIRCHPGFHLRLLINIKVRRTFFQYIKILISQHTPVIIYEVINYLSLIPV
jgi:hypothetical protein